ncbi:MAG: sodium/hydrogen exchanger [Verrucomicrobiaceae bacterium]|nr:sodium/hydrogen exchanger [Verrucomicrobiaceae bacterium]
MERQVCSRNVVLKGVMSIKSQLPRPPSISSQTSPSAFLLSTLTSQLPQLSTSPTSSSTIPALHLVPGLLQEGMPLLIHPPVLASAGVTPFVGMMAVLLVALVLLSLALNRLRQSLLVGYFVCGVAAANSGLLARFGGSGLHERMEGLADTGVVLLMFTLGIEFSFSELKHLRRAALLGGSVQVGLTALVIGFIGWRMGLNLPHAAILAVAVALSSTAVSMKTFQDLGINASPAARTSLGIAIFQDLLVIAFMLLLPVITGEGGGSILGALAATAGYSSAFILLSWLLGRYLIPELLHAVSRTRSRELFTLTVLALCVGVACLASAMGLSPALGAFVAGLVVSGSIYSHRVLADVLPFKDLFLTLFFVTVGLTIDLNVLAEHGWAVLGCTLGLLLLKSGILALATRLLTVPLRSAALTVAALASMGEFSLVLMAKARESIGWNESFYQVFVISTALSMALVPTLMRAAPTVAEWLEKHFNIKPAKATQADLSVSRRTKTLTDHAILCGYGLVGQKLHESLSRAGINCLIIELNVDTVRQLKRQGVPVLFADASHRETWELTRVSAARLVTFTFPDSIACAAAMLHLRELAPKVTVMARVKFASDADKLRECGIEHIIRDEMESASAIVRTAEEIFQVIGEE